MSVASFCVEKGNILPCPVVMCMMCNVVRSGHLHCSDALVMHCSHLVYSGLLQYSATIHCYNTVQCTVQCSVRVQWGRGQSCVQVSGRCSALTCTVHCTVLYCTLLYCTAILCTALYCTPLLCTALHCTVLYSIALSYTLLYCATLHCATPHNTLPHFTSP